MAYDGSTGEGAVDKGEVNAMLTRRRKEKKDKLFITAFPDELTKAIIGGKIYLEIRRAKDIIILEDEFKSSYDCSLCEGTGEIVSVCGKCEGKGKNRFDSDCPICSGQGEIVMTCTGCNGKGALLEIPDQAKARPTSGIIIAQGKECELYKIGERIAYTGYTGHLLPFKGNTRVRIMGENDAMCLVGEIAGATGETIEFIDKDNAYDLT